ncbi:MAG: Hsp20/alpha crystallin family protein [Nannocystaceae bacterium]|nr:Hsp20/alpha crystallin family protein [Nannocystaceae bacterium]
MIAHLLHYDPYKEFNELSRRVFGELERRAPTMRVPIDVREDEERFVVEADVPGLAPEDLEIVAAPERLTIKGTRKSANDKPTLRRERGDYSFERTLTLPQGIDLDAIEAKLEAGVLTVTLPKRASLKPRSIVVKGPTAAGA